MGHAVTLTLLIELQITIKLGRCYLNTTYIKELLFDTKCRSKKFGGGCSNLPYIARIQFYVLMQLMVSYFDLPIKNNIEMQFKLCARPISANKGQCIYAIDSTEREIHYGDDEE